MPSKNNNLKELKPESKTESIENNLIESKTEIVGVRLTPTKINEIEQLCNKDGVKLSEFIRQAINLKILFMSNKLDFTGNQTSNIDTSGVKILIQSLIEQIQELNKINSLIVYNMSRFPRKEVPDKKNRVYLLNIIKTFEKNKKEQAYRHDLTLLKLSDIESNTKIEKDLILDILMKYQEIFVYTTRGWDLVENYDSKLKEMNENV